MGNCCGNTNNVDEPVKVDQRKAEGQKPDVKRASEGVPPSELAAPFRAKASEAAKLRGQYFEQSKAAFERGEKGEAKRLSELGKAEGKKVEEANAQAAEAVLGAQDLASGTIDLHGLHVDEAIDAVKKFLDMHKGKRDTVNIITGKGIHVQESAHTKSKKGESQIKKDTHKLLKERGLAFVETTHGSVEVTM
jgi:DNA-nicking Smr family endonuclease